MFPRGWQCLAGGTQVGRLKVKGFNARKRPTGMLVLYLGPAYNRARQSWASSVQYCARSSLPMRSRNYSLT